MQLSIGQRIRRLRLEHGDTLEMLAKRSGVSLATLSRLENGARSPRLGQFVGEIARAYGVTPDRLYSDPAGDVAWMVQSLEPVHRLNLLRSTPYQRLYMVLRFLLKDCPGGVPAGEFVAGVGISAEDLTLLLSDWPQKEPDAKSLDNLVKVLVTKVGLPEEWFVAGCLPHEGLHAELQRYDLTEGVR